MSLSHISKRSYFLDFITILQEIDVDYLFIEEAARMIPCFHCF